MPKKTSPDISIGPNEARVLTELITTKDLQKSFSGDFHLGPINFSCTSGKVVAVLGQNGAGKSTFFNLLTGNLDATDGTVTFLGEKMTPDSYQLKRSTGYLPQNPYLPRWVTGVELLRYAINLYELPNPSQKLKEALTYWDCQEYARKPLAACSHGMQKRVALALSTIHEPQLLILDEPFSGLDLMHTKALEQEINRRRQAELGTILSTHVAPYTAKLCDAAYALKKGKLTSFSNWQDQTFQRRIEHIEDTFFKN